MEDLEQARGMKDIQRENLCKQKAKQGIIAEY